MKDHIAVTSMYFFAYSKVHWPIYSICLWLLNLSFVTDINKNYPPELLEKDTWVDFEWWIKISWLYPTTAASLKFIGSFQFHLHPQWLGYKWDFGVIDLCFNFGSATLQLYDLGKLLSFSDLYLIFWITGRVIMPVIPDWDSEISWWRFYILISMEWMINANDDYKQLKIHLPIPE